MAIGNIGGNYNIQDYYKNAGLGINAGNYEKFGGNNAQGIGGFNPEIQVGQGEKAGGLFGSNKATNPNSLAYFKQNILPNCNLNQPVHGDTDPEGNSHLAKNLNLIG